MKITCKKHSILLLWFMLISMQARGEPKNVIRPNTLVALKSYEQFTVISLKPSPKLKETEGFHGYQVLGKKSVIDKKKRSRIVALLQKNVTDDLDNTMGCFNPRHGLQLVNKSGHRVDLVICFECSSFYVFEGSQKYQVLLDFPLKDIFDQEFHDDNIKEIQEQL